MAVEVVEAMEVMVDQALVVVMILARVLGMVEPEGCMEVGEVMVAVVVTIPMAGETFS